MESVQKDILIILLGRIFELELISESTYKSARNSLASQIDLPKIWWYSAGSVKEGETSGCTQNTR